MQNKVFIQIKQGLTNVPIAYSICSAFRRALSHGLVKRWGLAILIQLGRVLQASYPSLKQNAANPISIDAFSTPAVAPLVEGGLYA